MNLEKIKLIYGNHKIQELSKSSYVIWKSRNKIDLCIGNTGDVLSFDNVREVIEGDKYITVLFNNTRIITYINKNNVKDIKRYLGSNYML